MYRGLLCCLGWCVGSAPDLLDCHAGFGLVGRSSLRCVVQPCVIIVIMVWGCCLSRSSRSRRDVAPPRLSHGGAVQKRGREQTTTHAGGE